MESKATGEPLGYISIIEIDIDAEYVLIHVSHMLHPCVAQQEILLSCNVAEPGKSHYKHVVFIYKACLMSFHVGKYSLVNR